MRIVISKRDADELGSGSGRLRTRSPRIFVLVRYPQNISAGLDHSCAGIGRTRTQGRQKVFAPAVGIRLCRYTAEAYMRYLFCSRAVVAWWPSPSRHYERSCEGKDGACCESRGNIAAQNDGRHHSRDVQPKDNQQSSSFRRRGPQKNSVHCNEMGHCSTSNVPVIARRFRRWIPLDDITSRRPRRSTPTSGDERRPGARRSDRSICPIHALNSATSQLVPIRPRIVDGA